MYLKNIKNNAHRKTLRKIYTLLYALSIFFFTKTSEAYDKNQLINIEKYLNTISSMSATFTQHGPENNITRTGKLYISKPGKLKWEYIQPKKLTILWNNSKISYFDHEMEEMTKIEQHNALATLLTKENISLTQSVNIISIIDHQNNIELIASQPSQDGEQYPYIVVNFTKKPEFKISTITIVNDEQSFTEILLSNILINKAINPDEFILKDKKIFNLRDN